MCNQDCNQGRTCTCRDEAPTPSIDELIACLKERSRIRRQIPTRKSVQNGEADRIADLLDEAAATLESVRDALREPTEEMLTIGVDATEFAFACKRQIRDAWKAMSAALIKDKP